jgi:phage tail-like protein
LREPQFSRLPLIWKKLDKQTVLERFLGVEDIELDSVRQQIEGLLSARDVYEIPDKFLKIIGYVVGHRWKDYRSYTWNRQRIAELIDKYSYKGSDACLSDLVYEHGGDWYKVIDMASLVGVYDRQATMPQSSHYFDADFFHQGVYQLWLPENIDLEHFLEDFEYIKPAGTKWLIRFCIADCYADIEILDYGTPISEYGATYDYTYKIFNQQFGFYDHIPQVAWEPVVYTTYWSYLHSPTPNVYGQAFYTYLPQYPVEPTVYTTIWADINSGGYNVYGESFYNFPLQLPVQPIITLLSDILAIGNARIDMASLTFDWGDPEFNFEDEYVPENYNWMQPLVEPIILT